MADDGLEPVITPLEPLSSGQIDAILVHLPHLESAAQGNFERGSTGMDMPDTAQSDRTYAFFSDLYDLSVVQPFEWMRWERGKEWTQSEEQLAAALLEDIQILIIGHVRFDRFADGHFDEMVKDGLFARILRRLAELRAEL